MSNNCRGGPPWPADWQNRMLGSSYGWPRRATRTVDIDRADTFRLISIHFYVVYLDRTAIFAP